MVERKDRLSEKGLFVLKTFLDSPVQPLSGSEITKRVKVSSGTLYPILARFEAAGWLTSQWEEEEPSDLARPRRRFYTITPSGEQRVKSSLIELAPLMGRLNDTFDQRIITYSKILSATDRAVKKLEGSRNSSANLESDIIDIQHEVSRLQDMNGSSWDGQSQISNDIHDALKSAQDFTAKMVDEWKHEITN